MTFKDGYKKWISGNLGSAVQRFEKIRGYDFAARDYLLYFLGRNYLELGECEAGREVFRELTRSYPRSRWAPYGEFQVRSRERCPPLSMAVEETEDCTDIEGGVRQADCLFRARRYLEAKEILLKLEPTLSNLVRLSQAAARSQDLKTALEANEELRHRFPRTAEARRSLWRISFLHRDGGDYRKAIQALHRLLSEDDSPRHRGRYWEEIGWSYYRLREWSQAAVAFEKAHSLNGSHFGRYWKVRSLEKLGRKRLARDLYWEIVREAPRTYYGLRSLERMYGRRIPKSVKREWWGERVKLRWTREKRFFEITPELEKVVQLADFDLREDAIVEVRRLRASNQFFLPSETENWRRETDRLVIQERVPRLEHEQFPIPYAGTLLGELKGMGVDPFLIYAMMRQESHYRSDAVSPAGAVGLMQIMPETGRKVAGQLQWLDYDPAWLRDPFTSLEIAATYLKQLKRQFGSRWYLWVSAYSAGEEVVSRWQGVRVALSEEEFIEEIPYVETRNYVKQVYLNWKAYQWAYR